MLIYETCVLLSPTTGEETRNQIISQTKEAVEGGSGEIFLTDEWGERDLAQPTSQGHRKGHYIYFLYEADGKVNEEVERRFRINESVLKHIIVKKGRNREEALKKYVTPYASNSAHRPSEEDI
ncbi:MAG: 30S ribosomal protein S6 [Bacteriovoracales bacterium]|nr:30S ribosomal protein S6 [Bacteriovoracales bacterium]